MPNDDRMLKELLELALHALITQRCERAYTHDLRGGMQGIYASAEALTRLAGGKTSSVPPERVMQVARNAIQNHEQGLMRALKHLVMQNDEADNVDLSALVPDIVRFLSTDAARHGISMRTELDGPIQVRVRPSKARLVLLAVLTTMIDAAPSGGELRISKEAAGLRFALQADAVPLSITDWVFEALKKITNDDHGQVTADANGVITVRYTSAQT